MDELKKVGTVPLEMHEITGHYGGNPVATNAGLNAEQDGAPRPRLEIGDLLVAYLEQLGVEYVFGIPGGAIEPLFNALARSAHRGGVRPVVARHETGAAFMAEGYARQTGRLGVCCATTGPGATNLLTGIAVAHENCIPMLAITAQTRLEDFGRGAFQESSCTAVNTVGMFQYCTRYSTLVSHVEQFERKLAAAVLNALHSPTGPAHLSIPLDILRSPAPVERPSYALDSKLTRVSLLDESGVKELCREMNKARKVVLVIGGGCSGCIGTILEVAVRLQATIVSTPDGKGLVSPYHPLFRGVIGFAGHSSATDALTDPTVDTVVAVGTSFGQWATSNWDSRALLNERLIHVEFTKGHLLRSPMAKLHVLGSIDAVFAQLLDHLGTGRQSEKLKAASKTKLSALWQRRSRPEPRRHFLLDDENKYQDDESIPIKPQWLMRALPRLFPPSTRYLADTGNSVAWAVHYLHPSDGPSPGWHDARGGVFRAALEFASMGWAIGAAIGTVLGDRRGPVVCITGDGALLMSGQEMTVAVQEGLPIVFVILNDSALGMVKHGQRLACAEPIGFELPRVDFCAYAKAMGADGYLIRSPKDLMRLDVKAICSQLGPTLLDVRVDPEEVPPMGVRMKGLGIT